MILEIIIGILGFLVVILGYTTFNLLRKNERAEDILVQYNEYLTELNKQITDFINSEKVEDIKSNSVSKDEAKSRVKQFFL